MEKLIGQFHDESKESYLIQVEELNEHIEMLGRKRKVTIEHFIEASLCGATIELIRHFHLGYSDRDEVTNSYTEDLKMKMNKNILKYYLETFSELNGYEETIETVALGVNNGISIYNAIFEMRNIILDLGNSLEADLINLANITSLQNDRIRLLSRLGIADVLNMSLPVDEYGNPLHLFLSNIQAQGEPLFTGLTDIDENNNVYYSIMGLNENRIHSQVLAITNQLKIIRGYNLFSKALAKTYNIEQLYLPITFKRNRVIEVYSSKIKENSNLIYKSIIENKDKGPEFKALYDFVTDFKVDFNPLEDVLMDYLKNPHVIREAHAKDLIQSTKNTLEHNILLVTQAPYFVIRDLGENLYEREK